MRDNICSEKSFTFAVRIVNLYKHLTDKRREHALSKQILRCGTGIGASVAEAMHEQNTDEYVLKMRHALKLANESYYWLKLLYKTDYIDKSQFISLNSDVNEMISILTSAVKNADSDK